MTLTTSSTPKVSRRTVPSKSRIFVPPGGHLGNRLGDGRKRRIAKCGVRHAVETDNGNIAGNVQAALSQPVDRDLAIRSDIARIAVGGSAPAKIVSRPALVLAASFSVS